MTVHVKHLVRPERIATTFTSCLLPALDKRKPSHQSASLVLQMMLADMFVIGHRLNLIEKGSRTFASLLIAAKLAALHVVVCALHFILTD